jgi:hypothetical protein
LESGLVVLAFNKDHRRSVMVPIFYASYSLMFYQEIDLLLSSSVPSILMPALPFVFLTNELQVLPAATLQNGHAPPASQITKQFFHPQIEEIKNEFSEVQAMGTATAEEWIKGLDERGKKQRSDAARWEKWEANGGVIRMRTLEPHEGIKSSAPTRTSTPSTTSTTFAHITQQTNGHNPAFQQHTSIQQMQGQVNQLHHPIHTSFRK